MFKEKLLNISSKIDSFTGNKNELMYGFIQRKLNRSLEEYVKEMNVQVNYLLLRSSRKVNKKLDCRNKNNKGDKNE